MVGDPNRFLMDVLLELKLVTRGVCDRFNIGLLDFVVVFSFVFVFGFFLFDDAIVIALPVVVTLKTRL